MKKVKQKETARQKETAPVTLVHLVNVVVGKETMVVWYGWQ